MVKPENPSAFPIGKQIQICEQGMTLRDYFANSAMQGIMSSGNAIPIQQHHFYNISEDAYRLADAMLKQREL